MEVTIYPIHKDTGIKFVDVDKVSFIDRDTHGPGHTFGVEDTFEGRMVLISSPNVAAVKVEDDEPIS